MILTPTQTAWLAAMSGQPISNLIVLLRKQETTHVPAIANEADQMIAKFVALPAMHRQDADELHRMYRTAKALRAEAEAERQLPHQPIAAVERGRADAIAIINDAIAAVEARIAEAQSNRGTVA